MKLFPTFMRQETAQRIINGEKLTARWGIAAVASATFVLFAHVAAPTIFISDLKNIAYVPILWVIPFVFGVVGLYRDDRLMFSYFGIFTAVLLGVPLAIMTAPLLS